jgi:peptide/nickel transport system permease protein
MSLYLLRRLLQMIPVLFLVSVIAFSIILLLPGDPAMAILGPDKARDVNLYQELRRELGLDKPIPLQYVSWLGKMLVGDFGISAHYQAPVTLLIRQSIGPTVQLALTAMLIALLIAVPIGIISAARPGSWLDIIGTTFALSGVAIPNFLLGILLILLFALTLRVLPSGGYVPPTQNPGESFRLMLMPAFALGAGLSAVLTRQIRSAMLEVLNQDYVTTARAKGLAGRTVVLRHALKNALIPVLTVIGVQIGRLMGGTVVIETIFAVPGMGKLAVGSIFFRDFPVVQAIVLIMGAAILISNLVTDLLYGVIDPRVRYS